MRALPIFVAALCCSLSASAQSNAASVAPLTAATQTVTVTATDRGLAGVNDSATSVAVLSQTQLAQQPGLLLDDGLHAVAGFQLFRRTSSWTANPTTEGVSLRGLGSTAASRTLVVSDQAPLNDPFGGWVHWDEIPALAIRQVELLRGGASDLYGSSAIGGVINVVPVMPAAAGKFVAQADVLGATENTAAGDALLSVAGRRVSVLGAASALETGGYVSTAPAFRGLVDTPSNVDEQSARLELRSVLDAHGDSVFLRGNGLNEDRDNGTPVQTNATRLWRYVAGADLTRAKTTAALRLYGSREGYRQSFSAIAANRNSETLSRLQRVPSDELGLVAQAARLFAHSLSVAADLDVRDIRATDAETPVVTTGVPGATTSDSARQRETGGFIDGLWQPGPWSISASVRVDSFHTFSAQQLVYPSASVTPLPAISELVASPRAGLVRQLPHGFALTATAFRAFRGPTMNELYRTGQVGSQITLANNWLLAERATGAEGGGEWTRAGWGHVRATYFFTEVNRPISAVLLSQTATAQTYQRQNLGQLQSRGLMVEAQTERRHGLDASFGYQLTVATVTAFRSGSPAQNDLSGKWLPEVPRESLTGTLNYNAARVASFHLIASYQGQEFDDAENQYLLHPYARFDLSADRALGHGVSVFAGAQNLLNRAIDAGRTPVLTLAAPRLVEGGLRYSFAR
jgi:outer membrane receptor protein involved in Fe transport